MNQPETDQGMYRLPLKGFPSGKYRLRVRNDDFPKVFVRTKEGMRVFIARVQDGHVVPTAEVALNKRGEIVGAEEKKPLQVDVSKLLNLVRKHMETSYEPPCDCEYQHGNCDAMDYRNAYRELADYLKELDTEQS